ncbi:cell adhesion molecule DSCAM-like isoform X3 [Dysidea avara]|uniref:cell adhesion molecule DSCAM-like isoform X3 n=1 Tax=Dysidea avara TaxID=196820 RepID=UPI00332C623E
MSTSGLLCVAFISFLTSGYSQQCQSPPHDSTLRVEAGSDLCINCPVQNADTWTKDNAIISVNILSNQSLLLRDVSEDDGGMYRCRMGSDFAGSFLVTVEIIRSPDPFTDSPTVYNESDSAVLMCRSEASPPPAGVLWRRNGVDASSDLTLTLSPINRSDAGVYECCYVTDVDFRRLCIDVTITVQYSPTTSTTPTTMTVSQGVDHMIQCMYGGLPAPTITWALNGVMLNDGVDRVTIATPGTGTSTLTITMVTSANSGMYTCTATNLLGTSMGSSELRVRVPPDPPTNVMITSEARRLSLTWTNPFDGFDTITMVMVTYQLNMPGSSPTSINTTSIRSYTINGLSPNKKYNVSLQSFNSVGGSGVTMEMINTIPLPPGAPVVTVTALSSTSLNVTWDVTITDEMTPVTRWTLRYRLTGSSDDLTISPSSLHSADSRGEVLTGLEKGKSYDVMVAANNSAGMGDVTTEMETTLVDLPSIPTNLSGRALSYDRIEITWEQVADNGGDEVDNFVLKITEVDTNMMVVDGRQFPGSQRKHIATNLRNNTEHRIELAAVNSAGQGNFAMIVERTLTFVMPGQPQGVDAVDVMDTSLRLTWQPVEGDNVVGYTIQYRLQASDTWRNVAERNVTSDVTSYDITDLLPYMTYEVRVLAVSDMGVTSFPSDLLTVTTLAEMVMISGRVFVMEGHRVMLECLRELDSQPPTSNPRWSKDVTGSLPDNVKLDGNRQHILVIDQAQFADTGVYTCSSAGDEASVMLNITMSISSGSSDGLETTEWILIGVGAAILLGIIILIICIICICCVRYRRRPTIYSPSKGRSNWIDGEGHTGIVFMASSYSAGQSPTQRESSTTAPYLGAEEDDFHNASTFNTLERSAIHRYKEQEPYQQDFYNSPYKNDDNLNQNNDTTMGVPHRAHYAELDLAPPTGHVAPPKNSVQYSKVDKSSFKQRHTPSPLGTQPPYSPQREIQPMTEQYNNEPYAYSPRYHPVTPGDTVV